MGGATANYVALQAQAARAAAVMRAGESPPLIEHVRAGVFAIALDAQEFVDARDAARAESFAADFRAERANVEDDWQKLLSVLPAEQKPRAADLKATLDDFIRLSAELVRLRTKEGLEAAATFGTHDSIRLTQQALTQGLNQLEATTLSVIRRTEAAAVASGRALSMVLLIEAGCAVAVTLAFMVWSARRSVALPRKALTAALGALATGYSADILLPEPGDGEAGEITSSVRLFLEKLRHHQELEQAAAAAHAARDLQNAALESYTQDFGQSVAVALLALADSVESARRAALAMAEASQDTRETAKTLSAGAEDSARNLSAVAAATEELTTSVSEITGQVAATAAQGQDALSQAQATNARMTELSSAAAHIDAVMQLIADIAGKTNLLALNATIEAARAGEAGKGFAVVASEVKALARQTAQATEQIETQVTAIQYAADAAQRSVSGMHDSNRRVAESASAMAEAVERQGLATGEIAGSVHRVVRQNAGVTQASRQVLELADRAGAVGEAIMSTAGEVSQVSMMLRNEVEHFLKTMRASDNKRVYKRLPGGGMSGVLRLAEGQESKFKLFDISHSGAALICSQTIPEGREIEMRFPDTDGIVLARVVRAGQGTIGIVFRQHEDTVKIVDQVMQAAQSRYQPAA